jgi:hypothetical protein
LLILVGPDGLSTELRPAAAVIDQLFDGEPAETRGGYVRVYPVGRTGHVGIPGRFYPETGAVCLSWDQSAPPRNCHRPPAPLAGLLGAPNVKLFRGTGVTLSTLVVITSATVIPVMSISSSCTVQFWFSRCDQIPRVCSRVSARGSWGSSSGPPVRSCSHPMSANMPANSATIAATIWGIDSV